MALTSSLCLAPCTREVSTVEKPRLDVTSQSVKTCTWCSIEKMPLGTELALGTQLQCSAQALISLSNANLLNLPSSLGSV